MSEDTLVELVQSALRSRGIDDEVLAAGQFNPRGHEVRRSSRSSCPVPGSSRRSTSG